MFLAGDEVGHAFVLWLSPFVECDEAALCTKLKKLRSHVCKLHAVNKARSQFKISKTAIEARKRM